jgi:hypothetical protein
MSEEKKPTISFEHLAGKKVGHHVPVKTERPIDFSSVGGKCVSKASEHPTAARAKPVEKEAARSRISGS